MNLMQEVNAKALELGVPLSAHLDITYRCNERCDHCYLDHDDKGEMSTAEICDLLDQLAAAGTFFLTISGGEPLLRRDFFEILSHARARLFNVKLKTNGVLIREKEARRLLELGVEQVQVSVYSHRAEVHDGITRLPGSLRRTLDAVRFLCAQGLRVTVANVLMTANFGDEGGVQAVARELGARFAIDPTITPKINGDTSVLALRISGEQLHQTFRTRELVGDVAAFCAPPAAVDADVLDGLPCSAGHTACYISPYGEVFPCVQFPLLCGNVRRQRFVDIWRDSPKMRQVRAIRGRDLTTCSGCGHLGTCTRCPGLAYMEGDMRGPSSADCQKSFQRTGIPSANMLARGAAARARGLVQIEAPRI